MINFFNTFIDKSAFKEVKKSLDSTFLSEGDTVKEFENQLSSILGLKNPVAVNSGTSALHLALDIAGIKKGDEVICPAQTFIATGLAILYMGAKPVFADISYETGNIDPVSIERKITKKTTAILTVDWAGYPCDYIQISRIAKKYNLKLIEDAAHALGAEYQGKPIGSVTSYTCFSFQAIKHLTTGDGGTVAFLNNDDAEKANIKRWFGIDRKNAKPSILGERVFQVTDVGYKYHLNNYAAALGIANLKTFKKRLAKRRTIAEKYNIALSKIPGIQLFHYINDRKSAYWLFGFHVERREDFIRAMKDRGISTTVVHQRIDRYNVFGGLKKDLINQKKFDLTQVNIPIHDGLKSENVNYIIKSIQKGW